MPRDEATNQVWVEELRGRHEEAIRIALRNFMVSRQFTTAGNLSEADRLARFYEGVVMSLQRNPLPDAFDAAVSAFKAVIRYEAKPSKDTASSTDSDKRALRAQASYNLAVLYHRRAVQLREAKNKKRAKAEMGDDNKRQEERGQLPMLGGKILEAVLTTEPQEQAQTVGPGPGNWKLIAELKDRASKDNKDLDESEYRKLRTESFKEATKRYQDVVDAVDQWGLKYEQLKKVEGWDHIILRTGIAAMVGILLMSAEQFNAQDAAAQFTATDSEKLERLLGVARSALRTPAERRSEANPSERGEAGDKTRTKEDGGAIMESWKSLANFFTGEPKKRRSRIQANDIFHKNIETEMLQQLDRAAKRLNLPRPKNLMMT